MELANSALFHDNCWQIIIISSSSCPTEQNRGMVDPRELASTHIQYLPKLPTY